MQGDPVIVRSIHINALSAPAVISYQLANDTGVVPAYCDGYIPIAGQHQIVFTCTTPMQVTIDLLSEANDLVFNSRGIAPSGNTTQITSNDSIQKGDIVSQGADGLGYWGADPSTALAALRPINRTATGYWGNTSAQNKFADTGQSANVFTCFESYKSGSNLYVFLAYAGAMINLYKLNSDGSLAGSQLNFDANGIQGSQVGTVNTMRASLIQLANGNIAIGYPCANGKFGICIFDSALTNIVAGPVYFGASVNNSPCHIYLAQDANGNIAAYFVESQVRHRYALFTQALAPIIAATTIKTQAAGAAPGTDGTFGDIDALPNGDVIIGLRDTNLGTFFVYRVTQAGAVTNPFNGTLAVGSTGPIVVKTLQSGMVFMFGGTVDAALYNPLTNALVTAKNSNAVSCLHGKQAIYDNGTSFVVCANTSNGAPVQTSVSIFNFDANTFAVLNSGTSANFTASCAFPRSCLDNGRYIFVGYSASTGTLLNVASIWFDASTFAPVVASQKSNWGDSKPPAGQISKNVFGVLPTGSLFSLSFFYQSGGPNQSASSMLTYYYQQVLTPIGVAQNDAPIGKAATVQTSGNSNIRLTFQQTYTVNAQAQTPPGQKMSVIGNAATLNGIQ